MFFLRPICPQYSSPGRTVWRWSLQRSAQASLEKCVSRSGSRHSVPETRPALRFTSKRDLFCGWLWDRLQWYDRKSYDGSDVDRMDDDYDDFFRQDISEGKDDDEDKDIPSVSLFLKSTIDSDSEFQSLMLSNFPSCGSWAPPSWIQQDLSGNPGRCELSIGFYCVTWKWLILQRFVQSLLFPQVAVDMRKTFRLVLEGKASNGGFAIDQMTFNPGDCPSMFMMIYSWLLY